MVVNKDRVLTNKGFVEPHNVDTNPMTLEQAHKTITKLQVKLKNQWDTWQSMKNVEHVKLVDKNNALVREVSEWRLKVDRVNHENSKLQEQIYDLEQKVAELSAAKPVSKKKVSKKKK